MKKKIISLLLVLSAFLFSLYFTTRPPKGKSSFEGVITYKIAIVSNAKNPEFDEYLNQKYGQKLIFTIDQDGDFRRDYISSGKKGYEFFIYNVRSNIYYSKWRNSKTIYDNSCSKNTLKFVEEKSVSDEKIFGHMCKGYYISGKLPESNRTASLSYYFRKHHREYIDPQLYIKFKDFFFDKVIRKMRSPFYKLIMDLEVYKVIFEIEKIERKSVNKSVFLIPVLKHKRQSFRK